MADLHVSLRIETRLRPDARRGDDASPLQDMFEGAARAAAQAAAAYLADGEYSGRSASVDYAVRYDVRTVPQSTPLDLRRVEQAVLVNEYGLIEAEDSPLDDPSDEPDTDAGPAAYGIYGGEV